MATPPGTPGRTNSLSHHRDRATFIGDHRARNRLELLSVRVLLFTWWDYTGAPERLVGQVRRALAARASGTNASAG